MGRLEMFSNEFRNALLLNETDITGALDRVCGNEDLYYKILSAFPDDTSLEQLKKNIADKSWDDAFSEAHALKGLAGNLGFVPLFHSVGELVIAIRAGRLSDVNEYLHRVQLCYDDIVTVIKNNT